MRRRLLNLLTVLSLLLCVAAGVLSVRSYWVDPPDRLGFDNSSFLLSSHGGVGWNSWNAVPPASLAEDWQFLGFGRSRAGVGSRTLTEWRVPYWFLALATAALPAWWLVLFLRRRAPDRGFEVAPGREKAGEA